MSAGEPIRWAEAHAVATELVGQLADACERIEIAGSIRRRKGEVHDIEIVVIGRRDSLAVDGLFDPTYLEVDALDLRLEGLLDEHLLAPRDVEIRRADGRIETGRRMGPAYKALVYRGMPVDLFITDAERWGCIYALRTGPGDWNTRLVTDCKRWFRSVADGRVLRLGRVVPTPEEADFFRALGVPWVEPWERSVERLRFDPEIHCGYSAEPGSSIAGHVAMAHKDPDPDALTCIGSNYVPGCEHFPATPADPPAAGVALLEIPIELIVVRDNVREELGDLESLAASIRRHGLLQPLLVQHEVVIGDVWVLVDGHRRLEACRLAGLDKVPVHVAGGGAVLTGGLRKSVQIEANAHHRDLNPIELALAYRAELADDGVTQVELARRHSVDASTIANSLRLLGTAPAVQALVATGKLTAAHAKGLAGLSAADQVRLATVAAERGYSAHQVERNAKEIRDREAERKRLVTENAAAVTRAIEALRAAGVNAGTPVRVSTSYNLDGIGIRAAVVVAGWPDSAADGWEDAEEGCDAVTIAVQVEDGEGSIVRRFCGSDEHRESRHAARRAVQEASAAAKEAEQQELEAAIAAALHAAIPPTLLRLIDRQQEDYGGKTWTEYGHLSDHDVELEIASRVSRSYGSKPIPHAKVIAALAAEAVNAFRDGGA